MLNVFVKNSAGEPHVRLYDGRIMPLEKLVREYERLLKEKKSIIPEKVDNKAITQELKVGEWFCIDREVIHIYKEEIRRKCDEAGTEGKTLWERFEESNKIAYEKPDQYPRFIKTYIFTHKWYYRTEREMRDMCKDKGDGMCDEVICDLELQMRICNGKPVEDLVKKPDRLPRTRVIELRNGSTGFFGGGVYHGCNRSPADLIRSNFTPDSKHYDYTPYVFRRILLWH